MATGEPRPGSDLPAPYRSPWSGLADSLRAVSADLRLGLRRLWRRNLEADLPRPGFWPAGLAPLFWPLLLVLLLALATLLLWMPLRTRLPLQPPASPSSTSAGANPEGGLRALSGEGSRTPASSTPGREPPASPPPPPGLGRGTATVGQPGDPAATGTAGADRSIAANQAAQPELQLDPLLELLSGAEESGLLQAAKPDPARSLLILTLSPAAAALPLPALQRRAEGWQQRAMAAGYERLELRDPQGHLRGRQALVGSGMILLAPAPSA